MPGMTGVFNADFAPFSTAVDGAVLKLRDIETGSAKVESSLTRMGNSFSGAKTIQEATLMARVFQDAGGAASFTEKELARMGATGAEAAAKLRALGQDVPPGIQKIADESKKVNTEQSALLGTVKDLAIGFAAMFTARAAFDFVKDTINEASALKDLSQQTHISVEELQVLAGGMSEFGVDADTLGKGLFKLSRGIAGGDDSVATGLHLMGMSLKDVDGLQGKDLFLKIESGLATLQGGLRDTAAAQLFGGKLGSAMAGASEGIQGALEKWQTLNHVASTESVDAMDTFGESIARADKNLSSIAANMIGPVAQGFNVVHDAVDRGASKWAVAWAMSKDMLAASTGLGTGTQNLTRLLDEQNKVADVAAAKAKALAAGHGEVAAAIDTRTQAEKFMAALEKDAAGTLDAAQLANLAHLKEIGALTAANAAGIGVNVGQFNNYKASIEAAEKARAELKRTSDEAAKAEAAGLLATTKLWDEYFTLRTSHGGTANEIAIAQIDQWAADLTAQMVKAGTDTRGFYDGLAALSKEKLDAVGVDWTFLNAHSREALQEMADNALKTYDAMIGSGKTFSRDILDAQLQKYHDLQDEARGVGATWKAAQDVAAAATKKANAELAAQIDKVHTLAGEWISAADAKKRFDQGNSVEVTKANFNTAAVGEANGTISGQSKSAVWGLLEQGFSLENAIALLAAGMSARDWKGDPGPRVPGFLEGGPTGAGGAAMLHRDEYVVPQGGALVMRDGGGGSAAAPVSVTIHTSGLLLSNTPAGRAEFAQFASTAIVEQLLASGWRPPAAVRR